MNISPLTKKAYDQTYKEGYDKEYPSIELVRIEKFFFNSKGVLLDFGCGPGSNGIHFLKKGYEVFFCDISDKALLNVKKKIKILDSKNNFKYKIINIFKNKSFFKRYLNSFDIIVCMSVFNNFQSEKEAVVYLKLFHSLLKKNGKLVIDSNLKNSNNYKKKIVNGKRYYTTNPKNDFILKMFFPKNQKKFVKMLKNNNFIINDIGNCNFKVFNTFEKEIIICATKI